MEFKNSLVVDICFEQFLLYSHGTFLYTSKKRKQLIGYFLKVALVYILMNNQLVSQHHHHSKHAGSLAAAFPSLHDYFPLFHLFPSFS